MNTEFKGTKGEWSWHTTGLHGKIYEIINTPKYPALFMLNPKYKMDAELQADIELVADAGNTIQSCGLLPSELLKQRDEMREMLSVLLPMFTELDSQFGKENPQERKWNENEIQTIQRISDFLESTEVKH